MCNKGRREFDRTFPSPLLYIDSAAQAFKRITNEQFQNFDRITNLNGKPCT